MHCHVDLQRSLSCICCGRNRRATRTSAARAASAARPAWPGSASAAPSARRGAAAGLRTQGKSSSGVYPDPYATHVLPPARSAIHCMHAGQSTHGRVHAACRVPGTPGVTSREDRQVCAHWLSRPRAPCCARPTRARPRLPWRASAAAPPRAPLGLADRHGKGVAAQPLRLPCAGGARPTMHAGCAQCCNSARRLEGPPKDPKPTGA